MDNFNQFQQFFNAIPPNNQFGQPQPQPQQGALPPAGPNVDQLTQQLEYSFIDIPDLISLSDEEEERLPPEERAKRQAEKQRWEAARRQAALQRALAGQGVVGAAPGFDPTPYQQHLLQQQQAQAQQQALAQQQQAAAQAAAFQQQAQAQQQQQAGFGFGQQAQQQQHQFGFGHFPPGGGN